LWDLLASAAQVVLTTGSIVTNSVALDWGIEVRLKQKEEKNMVRSSTTNN
jgi:hypothetical protein